MDRTILVEEEKRQLVTLRGVNIKGGQRLLTALLKTDFDIQRETGCIATTLFHTWDDTAILAASALRNLNVPHFERPECHEYWGKSNHPQSDVVAESMMLSTYE